MLPLALALIKTSPSFWHIFQKSLHFFNGKFSLIIQKSIFSCKMRIFWFMGKKMVIFCFYQQSMLESTMVSFLGLKITHFLKKRFFRTLCMSCLGPMNLSKFLIFLSNNNLKIEPRPGTKIKNYRMVVYDIFTIFTISSSSEQIVVQVTKCLNRLQ